MFRQIQMLRSKFFFFLFFYFITNNSFAKKSSQIEDGAAIGSSAENIFIQYSINASVTATIKSKIYFQYNNGDSEFPCDININIFDKKHDLVMTVRANNAYLFGGKKLWLLRGDVEVISFDNKKRRQINTELLYWDQDKEIIYNSNFVRIEGDDFSATGNNFFAKQDFGYYKINKVDCLVSTDKDNF
jgi:LPS export ABC transporter protein LptC